MPKASKIDPTQNISFLLKGPPGEGKTIAAASFAVLGEVYLAYIDKKSAPELFTFFKRIGRSDLLDRITIEYYSSHNINELFNRMVKMQDNPGHYVAGIMDSVTSLTKSAVNWSMSFRGTTSITKAEQATPDFPDYKVETSMVCQLLDMWKAQPWYSIWTAHPLPQLKMEGQGNKIQEVQKTSTIVTYGSKVAGIVPGEFSEQYHFGRQGGKRVIWTDMVGDDFAKTSLPLPKMLDVDNKLFYEVWKEAVNKGFENLEPKQEVDNAIKLSIDTPQGNVSRWKV